MCVCVRVIVCMCVSSKQHIMQQAKCEKSCWIYLIVLKQSKTKCSKLIFTFYDDTMVNSQLLLHFLHSILFDNANDIKLQLLPQIHKNIMDNRGGRDTAPAPPPGTYLLRGRILYYHLLESLLFERTEGRSCPPPK